MPTPVGAGAILKCSMGTTPTPLVVLPTSGVVGETPLASIADSVPFLNIQPFGMCQCPGNPTVAAATAAASGVLTPMPCVPATGSPWMVGSPDVLLEGVPMLDDASKLMCSYGGVIEVVSPGQEGITT
ncbi:MAG: DUF4280 domain-containing protein [Bacteroidetes bacterium]|nr:MAG: DUF4280 domain-containing protein [Bacteroidota bacterium]